ncbi:hypothetical protein GGR57DRAFT_486853 [Xylariaceae sp. FL1272]|nr:hypothetical protein GGR57DRAFT_486853 [Xylariaceae sp. FL1272]
MTDYLIYADILHDAALYILLHHIGLTHMHFSQARDFHSGAQSYKYGLSILSNLPFQIYPHLHRKYNTIYQSPRDTATKQKHKVYAQKSSPYTLHFTTPPHLSSAGETVLLVFNHNYHPRPHYVHARSPPQAQASASKALPNSQGTRRPLRRRRRRGKFSLASSRSPSRFPAASSSSLRSSTPLPDQNLLLPPPIPGTIKPGRRPRIRPLISARSGLDQNPAQYGRDRHQTRLDAASL